MAFQGSLKELPLPDIVQLVSVSGKTGVFVLTSNEQRGEIFLRGGEIVHASAGEMHGEEAVYELAIWQEGEFVFNPGVETTQHTVKKSNTNLLMEAARRIDEWKVLSKRIPSTRQVPTFTNQGSSTSVSFTPQEWRVICKIDERRSIDELAQVLGMSAFEVCKLLYGLVTAGLVELSDGGPSVDRERIEALPAQQVNVTAQRVYEEAKKLLADHEELAEIERTSRRVKGELDAGHGAAALLDMIRAFEQIIGDALGPQQSKQFVETVNQRLIG